MRSRPTQRIRCATWRIIPPKTPRIIKCRAAAHLSPATCVYHECSCSPSSPALRLLYAVFGSNAALFGSYDRFCRNLCATPDKKGTFSSYTSVCGWPQLLCRAPGGYRVPDYRLCDSAAAAVNDGAADKVQGDQFKERPDRMPHDACATPGYAACRGGAHRGA